jgi:hypothetical protein
MNLSVWTLILLAIGYGERVNLNHHYLDLLAALFLLILHASYLYRTQKSLDSDKEMMLNVTQTLNALTTEKDLIALPPPSSKQNGGYWMLIQLLITSLLLIVFFFSQGA